MSRQAVSDAIAMLKGVEKVGKQAAKMQADAIERIVEGSPLQLPVKTIRTELEGVLATLEATRPSVEERLQSTIEKTIDESSTAATQVQSLASQTLSGANVQTLASQAAGTSQAMATQAAQAAQEAVHQFNTTGVSGLASVASAQAAAIFDSFQKMTQPPSAAPSAASTAQEEEEEEETDPVLRAEMAKWEAEMAGMPATPATPEVEMPDSEVPAAEMPEWREGEVTAPVKVDIPEASDADSETDRLLQQEMAKFAAAAQQLNATQKRDFSSWAGASSDLTYGSKLLHLSRYNSFPYLNSKYALLGLHRQPFLGISRGGCAQPNTLKSIASTSFLAVAAEVGGQASPAHEFSSFNPNCSECTSDLKKPLKVGRSQIKPPKASDLKLKSKPKPKLSDLSKEKRVPSGRMERLSAYTGLAAGLAVGGIAEITKRAVGMSEKHSPSDPFMNASVILNPANAERIVNTLCRVRGAALKLGQMLSIADNSLISPELQSIFDRVRQGADFMPWAQTETQLTAQLGNDWRSKVTSFDEKPFAAASIGQVHMADLPDGRQAAIKIQYPGVAEGIDSDINNLVTIMNATRLVPDSLFLDDIVKVARKELAWEVDYIREAAAYKHFRQHLENDPVFYVPEVIQELTNRRVLTTEFLEGVPLDQVAELECLETRNLVGESLLRLTLTELFQWRCMQTDPNWSNFLFYTEKNQIGLLDFGASRYFTTSFVDTYIHIINSAANGDREGILHWSEKVGFLTGYEAKPLLDAHVDAIMILGEAFQVDAPFNFGNATTMARVTNIVPAILTHRLTAPPEEVYSLHRKMAGVFLLCTKLKCHMNIKHLWDEIWTEYEFGRPDLPQALAQIADGEVSSVSGN